MIHGERRSQVNVTENCDNANFKANLAKLYRASITRKEKPQHFQMYIVYSICQYQGKWRQRQCHTALRRCYCQDKLQQANQKKERKPPTWYQNYFECELERRVVIEAPAPRVMSAF